MLKMLKAVIFDMDGVLIQSEVIHFQIIQNILQKYEIDYEVDNHELFMGLKASELWTYIKNKYNLNISVEELLKLHIKQFLQFLKKANINPRKGCDKFIQELLNRNIKLAIASSGPSLLINEILEALKLKKYFSVIISGDDVDKVKPFPDIFIKTAKKMGFCPKECLVIEDSINGIKAAKNAGMKCIGFKNKQPFTQDFSDADFITESFVELNYDKISKLYEE